MIKPLLELIDALRDELKHFGQMLVLLDRQQEHLVSRAANDVSQSIDLVQAQGAQLEAARQRRERCRAVLATEVDTLENASFTELIPLFPAVYQPLVQALVDENNELLLRVRRRARQNQLLLQRSVEMMQQVMQTLGAPAAFSAWPGSATPRLTGAEYEAAELLSDL